MFALRARLNPRQAARNRRINRLIIAKLKMEEWDILSAAPISAIKRVAADKVKCPRNRFAVAQRKDQQQRITHCLANLGKERAGQIRLAPFARAGILIEIPKCVPMRLANLMTGKVDDLQPCLRRRPFFSDCLALA